LLDLKAHADTQATDGAAGATLMIYIAVVTVIGMLLLLASGAISGSVGGSLTVGFALILAALAVGIHEAWTMKRGALGWIVNMFVSILGVTLIAPLGGAAVALILSPFASGSSLAASGGGVMSLALIGMTGIVLAGAWGALWVVNRWRDKPASST
jgi:hypothetical protein